MIRVAAGDDTTSAATMPPLLQHRIRGALNAAGFESTGRKFSAGDYKGMTIFALVQRKLRVAPHGEKRGERSGGASLRYALSAPIRGERWSEWSKYTETNTTYITFCFTMYIMV